MDTDGTLRWSAGTDGTNVRNYQVWASNQPAFIPPVQPARQTEDLTTCLVQNNPSLYYHPIHHTCRENPIFTYCVIGVDENGVRSAPNCIAP